MSKEEHRASLAELLAQMGFEMVEPIERIQKLYLKRDDPRIDYSAQTKVIDQGTEITLPLAYKVSDLDGMACEQIALPILGFLHLGGTDPDVMEEISHLALRAIGMAFGSYIEQHVDNPSHVEYSLDSIWICLKRELTATIEMARKKRMEEEKKS